MSGELAGLSPKMKAIYVARTALNRTGFDLVRDPFRFRFLHAIELRSVSTVIDVGANTGQFGATLRAAGYAGRILSVEPLQAAFAELSARVASDGAWTAERAAVSDTPGTLTINVAGNSVSSSVLPISEHHVSAAPASDYVGVEEVPATTVDELVARHGIDPGRALLKIDVQGFEMPVLAGAAETLGRFAMVRTELSLTPLYDGQRLMHEVVAHLAERGFELWVVEPGFTDPHTRRLLQFDGTFVRAVGQ